MMPNVASQVRSTLSDDPEGLPLNDLLAIVDEFVHECASTEELGRRIFELEEELQEIYRDGLVYATFEQTEIFLAVLYHLGPILPSTSVMSWFDLVLRPALREPKLPTASVNHAKELIISSLQKAKETCAERVKDFRRRLMELYLLDTFNDGSGEDILEWAELGQDDRYKRTHWKHNLEDIILSFGNGNPEEFFDEIDAHFAIPSPRLQLFSLLNAYTNAPSFSSAAKVLSKHSLMLQLMHSLLLDNSSTAATLGVTLLVKILPFFAMYTREVLSSMLPRLFAILARIMCWKERPASSSLGDAIDMDFERELEHETNPFLKINPDLKWERLEMSFHAAASLPPSSRKYFTTLYYLYPANLLKFLRNPSLYMVDSGVPSPYVESWGQAFDEGLIHRRSKDLIQEHNCHPMLFRNDAISELSEQKFWEDYEISRIVSEAPMLDLRNLVVAMLARYHPNHGEENHASIQETSSSDTSTEEGNNNTSTSYTQFIRPIDISSGKAVIFLQDMINITVALKSNSDVEVVQPSSQGAHSLFQTNSIPSSGHIQAGPSSGGDSDLNSAQVAQAVSGLQREILVLRNDLNFELWLSRENAKHIGRLYEDRVLMKNTEAERQGLYNKLRSYRTRVNRLESDLQEQMRKAASAKNQYTDWNSELQQKLKELREEKKSWITEAATLRGREKELQARFTAQGKLLADANNELFDLQTQRKANQHKIDRLHDYDSQIQQFLAVQKTWDEDFARFNQREDEIKVMQTQFKQMQMKLSNMEEAQLDLEDQARGYRRQIQRLEARLIQMRQRADNSSLEFAEREIAASVDEKATLATTNERLSEENMELKDEVMELKAMVEVLKNRRGLVSEPRSPVL